MAHDLRRTITKSLRFWLDNICTYNQSRNIVKSDPETDVIIHLHTLQIYHTTRLAKVAVAKQQMSMENSPADHEYVDDQRDNDKGPAGTVSGN